MTNETMSDETPSQGADKRLLYCHCAYSRVVPKAVKNEVLKVLASSGRAFDAVPDLCESAARCDPSLKKLADVSQGEVDIVACYPRAVRWLFHAAESPLPDDGVSIHNMRTDSAADILDNLGLAEAVPDSDSDPNPADADADADAADAPSAQQEAAT